MKKGRIEHVFLVRVWREAGPDSAWRGSIDHVPSGKREYFSALGTLIGCIEDWLGGARASGNRDNGNGVWREGPLR